MSKSKCKGCGPTNWKPPAPEVPLTQAEMHAEILTNPKAQAIILENLLKALVATKCEKVYQPENLEYPYRVEVSVNDISRLKTANIAIQPIDPDTIGIFLPHL